MQDCNMEKYFAHETAVIDEGCQIGEGTKIWHFSHIMKNASLGAGCNVGQNVVISPEVVLPIARVSKEFASINSALFTTDLK